MRSAFRYVNAAALTVLVLASCAHGPSGDEFGPTPDRDALEAVEGTPRVEIVGHVTGFDTESAWVTLGLSPTWTKIAEQPGACSLWARTRVRVPPPDAGVDSRTDSFAALETFAEAQAPGEQLTQSSVLVSGGAAVPMGQESVGVNFAAADLEGDLGSGRMDLTYLVRQEAQLTLVPLADGGQGEMQMLEWRIELAFACPMGERDPAALDTLLASTRVALLYGLESLGEWPQPQRTP